MVREDENGYSPQIDYDFTLFSDTDYYLFAEGSHFQLYDRLGAHIAEVEGRRGVFFAVWAPNAWAVSVIGDFNGWMPGVHRLGRRHMDSGIWEGFIPGLEKGCLYKYHIESRQNGYRVDKADPYGFCHETSPRTGSVVWDLDYAWSDNEWMTGRRQQNSLNGPMSIYEVHLGSWQRVPEEDNRHLTYREIAPRLANYVKETGFTHVEFLPVMEHPFYGSWGYQVLGFFAPTSRYGTPQDFMYLVDHLHREGIGVILDWVPSHFPSDVHGLVYFDGTHLYEHEDNRIGYHPEWTSYIFNYGRHEVRNFLISSAMFWLKKYHVDGLRVDAVASMLYLDYARKDGDWLPNRFGGKENLDAIYFMRRMNEVLYSEEPDINVIAEESTAWPMVTRPTSVGGLGFGLKWNMGWMHDILYYFSRDPVFRSYHHNQITFSIWYAFNENFMLPLSHDEVVHGKGSLINKMPGDIWQKFANLRLLYGLMYSHPGKKLLFMGGEFGQWREWTHDESLDWHLLDKPEHQGLKRWLSDLNYFYRNNPTLFELDFDPAGFEWIDFSDWQQSVVSFLRRGKNFGQYTLVACNFTPVPRHNYIVGVPEGGFWKERLNSDAVEYGGGGVGNRGGVEALPQGSHGRPCSIELELPPLGAVILTRGLEC